MSWHSLTLNTTYICTRINIMCHACWFCDKFGIQLSQSSEFKSVKFSGHLVQKWQVFQFYSLNQPELINSFLNLNLKRILNRLYLKIIMWNWHYHILSLSVILRPTLEQKMTPLSSIFCRFHTLLRLFKSCCETQMYVVKLEISWMHVNACNEIKIS